MERDISYELQSSQDLLLCNCESVSAATILSEFAFQSKMIVLAEYFLNCIVITDSFFEFSSWIFLKLIEV